MKRFSKSDIDNMSMYGHGLTWRTYRKTSLTKATRIMGPFIVETSEGELSCRDGYLAIDARGYPYPIAADEFEKIYEVSPAERVE